MIPEMTVNLTELTTVTPSNRTFAIDFENGRIGAKIDGLEAIRQAALLILLTERYEYLIHSHEYGFEHSNLIGLPIEIAVVIAETRIREALLADARIIAVDNFEHTVEGGQVTCYCYVHTLLGDFEMQTEVIS